MSTGQMVGRSPPPMMPIDRDARLRQLAADNYQFIWRLLRGLGVPPSLVDDATQQVFVVVTQKIDLVTLGSERAFLFQTALRAAMSVRRDRARDRLEFDDLSEQANNGLQPDEEVEARRYRAYLDQVLDALPDDLRAVFLLFEVEGMTTAQIAELLELPPGTAASRLRRAREEFHAAAKRLRARLQRGGDP